MPKSKLIKKQQTTQWYNGNPEVEAIITTRGNPKPLTEEEKQKQIELRKRGASGLAAISSVAQMAGVPGAVIGTLPALGWDIIDAIENPKEISHVGLDVAPSTYPLLKFAAKTLTPGWSWDDYAVDGLNILGTADDTTGAFGKDILHGNSNIKYFRMADPNSGNNKNKFQRQTK